MVITRVAPLSAAKVFGVINALIGVVVGALFSLAGLVGAMAAPDGGGAFMGMIFGVGAIVVLPVVYGCMGFLVTLFTAGIYNVIASAIGGIEVDAS